MANLERITEIKNLVKEKEEGIIQEYISLGKLYFNIHKDDEMQMFKDVTDILKLQAEIRDLEEELSVLVEDEENEEFVPSKESVPVADGYQEDATIGRTEYIYQQIVKEKENAAAEESVCVTEVAVEETVFSVNAEENPASEEVMEVEEPVVSENVEVDEDEEPVVSENVEEIPVEEEVADENFADEKAVETEISEENGTEDSQIMEMIDETANEEQPAVQTVAVEMNADSIFDNEKTCILTDNFVGGFDNNHSDMVLKPMPSMQSEPVVTPNPFAQPGFGNGYGQPVNSQPQPINANPFQPQFSQPVNSQPQPINQQPFGGYGFQTKVETPVSVPTADSAIDNEATMILDSFIAKPSAPQPQMQPQSKANGIVCKNCGKEAPEANFCIFCGTRMK